MVVCGLMSSIFQLWIFQPIHLQLLSGIQHNKWYLFSIYPYLFTLSQLFSLSTLFNSFNSMTLPAISDCLPLLYFLSFLSSHHQFFSISRTFFISTKISYLLHTKACNILSLFCHVNELLIH